MQSTTYTPASMYGGSFNGPYHMMPSTSNYQSTTVDLKKSKADAEKLDAEKAEAQAFEAKLRARAKTAYAKAQVELRRRKLLEEPPWRVKRREWVLARRVRKAQEAVDPWEDQVSWSSDEEDDMY